MQNDQGLGTANSLIHQQPTGGMPPVPTIGDTAGVSQDIPPPAAVKAPFKLHTSRRWLWIALGIIVGLFIVGGIIVVLLTSKSNNGQQQVLSGSFNSVQIPLDDLNVSGLAGTDTNSLKVNGELQLSGSMALTPTLQPQNPARGQLYFDQGSNQLMYYNGQQFIAAGGSSSNTNNTFNNTTNNSTNVTNIFNSGGGSVDVQLQGSAPGVQQAGNFNVSGIGQVGTLRTGAVGYNGDLSVTTDAASGATGNITIKSGDSSTTASGNIDIDAGNGIIDGEVVEDKTFESGLDGMQDWFNTTIATTTEQAHSGSQSLKMTPSSNFWGIIEQLPGTPVTPGHQYHFSVWVRAAAVGQSVGGEVAWEGTGLTTSFTPVIDNTTGWTELTLTAPAPAGASFVHFQMRSNIGTAGAAHYFDDITITDLSSSSAFSSIDIGTVNAKVITIGNMNQIGATTVQGSSGVTINGGAGNLNMSGGSVNLTGNGASTISTSAGTLTLTSADAATWSVGASSTGGVGGDLTLHAGGGGFGNNDGGNLILQGGTSTGTGIGGGVVVRPQTDSTTAFQIQSSTNAKLFVADSTNLRLYVGDPAGSASPVVLVLSNKTTAGDPAPVNGSMYFNAALGKFRCYQNEWRDCIGDDIINTYRYTNEFGNTITNTTGADNTLLSSFTGTGAGSPNGGGDVQHPGIAGLNTGTTATGQAGYMSGNPSGSTTLRLGNNVAWTFRSAVRVNTVSTGTDTHAVRVGFLDSATGEPTDGCFFRYTDSVNGGNWQGVCRDNNVESVCDTGVAVTAMTWRTMQIGVAADASVANFVISGVQRCTINTNIPTASTRTTGFGLSIIKSAGTTPAQVDIDFMDIRATGSGFGSRE